ncbi:MAG: bile acid:sodium symporter, partial [Acetobacter sp.]|nr:bile acid:sodium symporter [Acetobacter sp.]
IVYQLLVPFILGQICQPLLGAWAHRNKMLLSFTDRGSVLVVVYVAFSSAVVEGLWHKLPLEQLGVIVLADIVLLFTVIIITTCISHVLRVPYEDEIPIVFCGSKKTLASGIPMAEILFPPATVGITVIPLMIYHQIQLFTCAILAQYFKKKMDHIIAMREQTCKTPPCKT